MANIITKNNFSLEMSYSWKSFSSNLLGPMNLLSIIWKKGLRLSQKQIMNSVLKNWKKVLIFLSDSQKFKSYDDFLVNLLKNINPNNKESVSY